MPRKKEPNGQLDFNVFNNGWSCVNYDYDSESVARVTYVALSALLTDITLDADKDPFTLYCIERILVHSDVLEPSSWQIRMGNGYYGPEVCGIGLDLDIRNKVEDKIYEVVKAASNRDKLFLALKTEYGYILPQLEPIKNWEIRTVNKNDIIIPQTDHYRHLNRKALARYQKYKNPIGVVIEDRGTTLGKYRLVDGYHRLYASLEDKKNETVSVVVGTI